MRSTSDSRSCYTFQWLKNHYTDASNCEIMTRRSRAREFRKKDIHSNIQPYMKVNTKGGRAIIRLQPCTEKRIKSSSASYSCKHSKGRTRRHIGRCSLHRRSWRKKRQVQQRWWSRRQRKTKTKTQRQRRMCMLQQTTQQWQQRSRQQQKTQQQEKRTRQQSR